MTASTTIPIRPASRWPDGHPRRRQILLVMCLSLIIVVVDNTVLNTALPTIARDLHAGTSSLQWIVDAYTLCFASLLIPAGALGDRHGRRASLLAGLTVFAIGSGLAAFASGAEALVAARVVMGLGAAFVMPTTLSILNAVFPPQEREQAIAVWAGVAGIGIVIGPTLSGFLLTHFWWGSVFLINIPVVSAVFVSVLRVVPETADPGRRKLDVRGAVLVAVGLLVLVDAIIEAPTRGWTSPWTLIEASVGLGVLAGFVAWELHIPEPLIDLRVFTSKPFTAACSSVTVIFFTLSGCMFVFTQYFQLVRNYSPLSAGVRVFPFAVAIGVVSPVSAAIVKRFGDRAVVPPGLTLIGVGLLDMSSVGVHTTYPAVALAFAVTGAGMGLVMAPASSAIMTAVPSRQAGAGSAINDTIREIGAALGVAVIGSIAASLYRSRLTTGLNAGHAAASVVHLAGSSLAAANSLGKALGPTRGGQLVQAAHQSFTTAMGMGMRIAAAVAFVAAPAIMLLLSRSPKAASQPETPALTASAEAA